MRNEGLILAAAVLLSAAPLAHAQEVHPGKTQGLGLTGPQVPQILRDAQENPYLLPKKPTCAALSAQIVELDKVLGRDLDAPQIKTRKSHADDLMAGVRAVMPYGGVLRTLTGAERKEQRLVNAALAGWERRGYLKGVALTRKCRLPPPPPPPLPPKDDDEDSDKPSR
jgi:hypothetical protein